MNEFDLIARYFSPLAGPQPDSLNLKDDAALIDVPPGMQLVVSKDAMSEEVHFFGDEDPALLARKLLRTNLSDMAAMGAEPYCYFLALALPRPLSEEYIKRFTEGLAEDQRLFNVFLAGGDTIATKGTPTFSLTIHGFVPKGGALLRSTGRVGDSIYVTGTLGDAALGLEAIRNPAINRNEHAYLTDRYLLPAPRIMAGKLLRGQATSCIDISDGLLQDMGHICDVSHVGAELVLEQLPLSPAAREWVEKDASAWPYIYSGGDDYELLFTLPAGTELPATIQATKIGKIVEGDKVSLLSNGKDITPEKTGYSH